MAILGWFSGKWQGLSNCGILSAIRSNPDIFEPVFTIGYSTQIKPEMFIDQLEVEFSTSQLLKAKEIDVYKYFCNFIDLLDQKEGRCTACTVGYSKVHKLFKSILKFTGIV